MNYVNLQLDKQICHRLYIASNAVTRLYRPLLDEIGLTYPQYVLMMALWEMEEAPILELQKKTKIDPGSLTLILKKIQAKKLINIKANTEDKRKKIVTLSTKGLKLKDKAHGIPLKLSCNIEGLSSKDLKDLIRILDKLNSDIVG